MSKIQKTEMRTIAHGQSLKDFFTNRDVPATHIGRIIDGSQMEVPAIEPNSDRGLVSEEFAYWSTIQAHRSGFKFGFISCLVIGLLLIILILVIINSF